jgi:hypothetical protein
MHPQARWTLAALALSACAQEARSTSRAADALVVTDVQGLSGATANYTSVSLAGDTLVVGSPRSTSTPDGGTQALLTGAAFVYSHQDGGWVLGQALVPADGAQLDEFGIAVSLSGTTLAIGADRVDKGTLADEGAVYVFDLAGGAWSQTQKLAAATHTGALDDFGYAVSLDGTTLAIGAPSAGYSQNAEGLVYVFTKGPQGRWTQ